MCVTRDLYEVFTVKTVCTKKTPEKAVANVGVEESFFSVS